MANEHILVVEDDPSVRILLEKSLTAKGYQVSLAKDGLAGLSSLEQLKPDLLLVDIMMPRLDGMTFVKAIKANLEMLNSYDQVVFCFDMDEPGREAVGR